jgi:hypothetical protein
MEDVVDDWQSISQLNPYDSKVSDKRTIHSKQMDLPIIIVPDNIK